MTTPFDPASKSSDSFSWAALRPDEQRLLAHGLRALLRERVTALNAYNDSKSPTSAYGLATSSEFGIPGIERILSGIDPDWRKTPRDGAGDTGTVMWIDRRVRLHDSITIVRDERADRTEVHSKQYGLIGTGANARDALVVASLFRV